MGYPLEKYKLHTQDKYTLGLERIPYSKRGNRSIGKPILLLHGLFSSSYAFAFTNKSLSKSFVKRFLLLLLLNTMSTKNRCHTTCSANINIILLNLYDLIIIEVEPFYVPVYNCNPVLYLGVCVYIIYLYTKWFFKHAQSIFIAK